MRSLKVWPWERQFVKLPLAHERGFRVRRPGLVGGCLFCLHLKPIQNIQTWIKILVVSAHRFCCHPELEDFERGLHTNSKKVKRFSA